MGSEEKKPESGVSMQEGLQRSRNSREDSGSIIPKKPKIDHTSQMSFLIAFFFFYVILQKEKCPINQNLLWFSSEMTLVAQQFLACLDP